MSMIVAADDRDADDDSTATRINESIEKTMQFNNIMEFESELTNNNVSL